MSTNSVPTDPLAALDALVATSAHQQARQAEFAEWVHCRQQDRALLREAFDAVRHYQCADGSEAFALGWGVAIHEAAERVRANALKSELDKHNPSEEAEVLQAAKQVLRAALQGIEAATTAARKLASAPICEDIRFYFGVLGSNFVGLLERRDEEEAWRLYPDQMPQAVANTEETPAPNADELPEHTGEGTANSEPDESVVDQPAPSEIPGDFVMLFEGDTVFVRAFGKEGRFTHKLGWDVLAKLLSNTGSPVLYADILDIIQPQNYDPRSVQPAHDRPYLEALKDDYSEAEADVEKAQEGIEKEEAVERRDKVRAQLKSALGLGGTSRDLNDATGGQRNTINQRLQSVYKKLRDEKKPMKELAEHLKNAIRAENGTYSYNPKSPAPEWKILT